MNWAFYLLRYIQFHTCKKIVKYHNLVDLHDSDLNLIPLIDFRNDFS